MFLGKPVLALPEPANFEQEINARLLARGLCGTWIGPDAIRSEQVKAFLRRLNWFGSNIRKQRVDGTEAAAIALERFLPERVRPQAGLPQRARPLGRVLTPAVVGPG